MQGVVIRRHPWDKSYIHRKIFWCYFEQGVLVSLHDKAGANLRIYKKTRVYMKEIADRSIHMPNDWYTMKICTSTMHGIYRIYYKLLTVNGEESITCDYHKLVHGPRTIEFNTALMPHLIHTILQQIRSIYHMVSTKYVQKLQDQTTMVGVRCNKAIESFLTFYDRFYGHFKNGKPVLLNWL